MSEKEYRLTTINVETPTRERFGAFVQGLEGKTRGVLAEHATKALEEYMEKHGSNGRASKR